MGKIIIFETVRDSIKADKLLSEQGYAYRVIAIPSYISSDCGMCVEATEQADEILQCLTENGFTLEIHDFTTKEKKR